QKRWFGAAVVLVCHWFLQLSPCSSPPQRKVHVLLLSSWRSGSSFLGQVFSQHPSVFYLMEPAWHVWTRAERPRARLLRMAVRDCLWSLYQCDFSVMDAYLPENPRVSSLFMWTESQALCSPPACSITANNETQCLQKCDAAGLQTAEKACSSYSHVVIKETRLFELESLFPLLQDPTLDLRIIHLVRDPRAVLRSREESAAYLEFDDAVVLGQKKVDQVQYEVMKEICQSHIRISETAFLNPPSFLGGRYKLVRYEDVVRNPIKEASDLYDFVGLEMTEKVGEWIYRKTRGRRKGTWKDAFQIISRDATQVSEAWGTMLPHSKVSLIQEVCKEAMWLLGYRKVDSEKQQKTLDLDLLDPLDPHKNQRNT
uniref:Carbohydrate sulfotransferase 6 n=1 Tax=Nothobranchius furzeri TaxID=105023 RepID=A0A8C6PTC7_NOTFU